MRSGRGKTRSKVGTRVAVAVVGIPVLLFVAKEGEIWLLVTVAAMILLGMREFYLLWKDRGVRPCWPLGIMGGVAVSCGAYLWLEGGLSAILSLFLLALLVSSLWRRRGVGSASVTVLGLLYLGLLGSHLILLRELPRTVGIDYSWGGLLLIFTMVLSWAGDTAAYFVGLGWGRHKLSPRISPNKTVEGALGHGGGVIVAALICRKAFLEFLPISHCLTMGILATTAGQVGDLVESMMKREAAVKDTSGLIPGHGGILDRFDSLLFIAPVEYYYLRFIVLR